MARKTKNSPPPKAHGRPRATAPAEIVAAATEVAVEAIRYVRSVILDESAEHKDRLRAATLALEYGTRPVEFECHW